jgi:hypothetical protein
MPELILGFRQTGGIHLILRWIEDQHDPGFRWGDERFSGSSGWNRQKQNRGASLRRGGKSV